MQVALHFSSGSLLVPVDLLYPVQCMYTRPDSFKTLCSWSITVNAIVNGKLFDVNVNVTTAAVQGPYQVLSRNSSF